MIDNKDYKKRAAFAFGIYLLCLIWAITLKCNMVQAVVESRYFFGRMELFERFVYCTSIFMRTDTKDAIANIILFLPVGLIVPFLFDKRAFISTVVLGAAISLALELFQILSSIGMFTYIDIINNTLGAAMGAAIHFLIRKRATATLADIAIKAYIIISLGIAIFGVIRTVGCFDIYITDDLTKYL